MVSDRSGRSEKIIRKVLDQKRRVFNTSGSFFSGCFFCFSERFSRISGRAANTQTASPFFVGTPHVITSIGARPLRHQSRPNLLRRTLLCSARLCTPSLSVVGPVYREIFGGGMILASVFDRNFRSVLQPEINHREK